MTIIGFGTAAPDQEMFRIDLGQADSAGEFTGGTLGFTGGNLYLFVDGQEYGSLYFTEEGGDLQVTLGQYTTRTEEWEPTNPIVGPTPGEVNIDQGVRRELLLDFLDTMRSEAIFLCERVFDPSHRGYPSEIMTETGWSDEELVGMYLTRLEKERA